jgi:hypothetical protein
MRKITKLFNIDIKSVDAENRLITFCFSDDQVDRMGEVVDQASWDVKNYMNNPLILFGHDPSQPENVLGQGQNLDLNNQGKSYVTAQFDEAEINPRADMIFRQLIKRTLRCVSAGFINHTCNTEGDVPILKDNELLEISIVPIPANPRAMALSLRDGSLSRKDANWLLDGMKTETELIEKQLKTGDISDGVKQKDMEELTTQVTNLTALVSKLAEGQVAITEAIAAQAPVVETEEAKTAREAEEAIAAQKVIDDQAEADRIAQEAADAAKDGGNDQSGAGEDLPELDLDSELTDEQLAEATTALTEELDGALEN